MLRRLHTPLRRLATETLEEGIWMILATLFIMMMAVGLVVGIVVCGLYLLVSFLDALAYTETEGNDG